MEILQFNKVSFDNYREFIKKYNSKELESLDIQTIIDDKKEIYLVIERGIIKKYKILAYCIIDKNIEIMRIACHMNEKYDKCLNYVFITDFMVKKTCRNRGIGKYLANYILNEKYSQNTILLQPDGDGFWFWKKFGFINDNISEHETWILRRN